MAVIGSIIKGIIELADSVISEENASKNQHIVLKQLLEKAKDTKFGKDHSFNEILESENKQIELVVLLFANAATITDKLINKGVEILKKNSSLDSAVTTSIYNMWSPLRARKLQKDGTLSPFVPFKVFGNPKTLNCDRDSQGEVYYADMSVSVVRPKCLEDIKKGLLPQKWMGKKIYPLTQTGGLDIDYPYELPLAENWLKEKGFTEEKLPYNKKK